MKSKPFFSIIIANYNFGHLLSASIESILDQDCDDYEIIIVDGGSTDKSVEVIKKYEDFITWWVSEPDTGQSNAFNKGFSHSHGRFLTWLNADDLLLPGTFSAVKLKLQGHPDASWATGNFLRFNHRDGKIIEAPWGPNVLPSWLQGKGRITISFGPTTFWSREAYDEVGPLDENLHLAMDIDYWNRLNMAGYKQVRVNHVCWAFRMHVDSKTAEFEGHEKSEANKLAMAKEKAYIINKNNYHPTKFWRYMGLFMRCVDGSILKAIFNRLFVVGKNIQDLYNIKYNILFNTQKS